MGVEHILAGIDHLLFVLALLLIVDGTRRLVMTTTAFTVAHSITLVAATLGWLHVPGPPVEAIIALSIVFVAAVVGLQALVARLVAVRGDWITAATAYGIGAVAAFWTIERVVGFWG